MFTTGCSGSGSGSANSPTVATQAASVSFATQAASICTGAQASLKALPSQPTSIAAGLELEHSALAVLTREVTQLQKLKPPPSIAIQFHTGLNDDHLLVWLFGSILQRPDFVQLSLTLPGHPQLAPAWLKAWLARSHALQTNAKASFAEIGIPACEQTLS